MRSHSALAALFLLAFQGSGPAAQDASFAPFPLRFHADGGAGHDAESAELLARQTRARLAFPLPSGERLELEVERVPVLGARAELWIDGAPVEAQRGDLTLWSGSVAGEPGSSVFLAFSAHGSRGWVRSGASTWHLVAEPDPERGWSAPRARVVSSAYLALEARERATCVSPRRSANRARPSAEPQRTEVALAGAAPLLECRIALETDYQLYQLFGDVDAAHTYVLTLFGAVSERFRGEIGVILTAAYVGLWTTPADPWTSPDVSAAPIDLLNEFSAAWSQGLPVEADLAHFLSGAPLGGGAGWHEALCAADYGHSVTTWIDAQGSFPVAPGGVLNHDFNVMAHELGHNFGAIHTHDYCPPLDECAGPGLFGPCQTQHACTSSGTLMSYCGLCPGGDANVTTFFHEQSKADMRAFAESSCLRPFAGVFADDLGFATAGSQGEPTLDASWSGGALVLSSSNVVPPTTGFLIVGLFPIYFPVDVGVLVPFPLAVLTYPVPSAPASLPLFLNGSFPTGLTLYAQSWFIDVNSPPTFVSGTPGIEIELIVPDPPAPATWQAHPSNGFEYALTTEGSWYHCEGEARTHGGHLVAITDAALESWLRATFYDSGLAQGALWIGLTDAFTEGSFHWTSGAPLTYTHWAPGDPTDGGGSWDAAYWSWGDVWFAAFGYFWFAGQRGLMQRPVGS